ncbi:MAG: hypothetical protein RR356_06930 [Bacteroidales bacterium]
MKTFKYGFFLFFAILMLFSSCHKQPQFSEIPHIEFISFEVSDNGDFGEQGLLTVYFQDGNGDIGLNSTDTMPPFDTSSIYQYNFFVDYYEKQQGEFVKVELPASLNMRIPRLSNTVPESIEGEMMMKMETINNPNSTFDTIRFECYLVDRALNKSNTITTSEIITKK